MQKTLKEMLLEIFLMTLGFSCKYLLAYFCQAVTQYLSLINDPTTSLLALIIMKMRHNHVKPILNKKIKSRNPLEFKAYFKG